MYEYVEEYEGFTESAQGLKAKNKDRRTQLYHNSILVYKLLKRYTTILNEVVLEDLNGERFTEKPAFFTSL